MWENEHKKTIIRNGILFLVLVLLICGLSAAMLSVIRRIEEEDAQLNAIHTNQRQELNAARQENLDSVNQVYAGHLETLNRFLPGIVCWGDSLTAGSSGNVSYPLVLQKYIDTCICDIYDWRYSVENPEIYPRLTWDDYQISIPVVNMGGGKENSSTILGRSGTRSYVAADAFVIPAGKERVSISLISQNGKPVTPLLAGNAGVNPVTIAGVEGTLTRMTNKGSWDSGYQFARLEEGQEIQVDKGTEIRTAAAEAYENYIHIVWLGTYGEYMSATDLVNETKALLQRQTANSDRYLVIAPCATLGSWTSVSADTLDAIDSAMLQAFGSHYVNLRKYLLEDGLRDAKLEPTQADVESIQRKQVPDSFRSNAGGADLNGAAYPLIGKLVYERMELLGYFDEVREAMNLDKIIQDILKEDPEYFETFLKG